MPCGPQADAPLMSDRGDYRLVLASARAELLGGQVDVQRGVPDFLAASWRRSLDSGVSPDLMKNQFVTDLDIASRLVRCAQPVIDQLSEQLTDVPLCVVLTDNKARILLRKDSTQWIARALDRVYFAAGFDYAEGSVGTNGVGTVLEYGASVQIRGAEHFVDSLQDFACTGAPIRNPFSGRIEGVLDITCLLDQYTPVLHSLVRSAAQDVERNLLHDRNHAQQALFNVFTRLDSRTREPVIAVGLRMTMANSAMETLLGSGDQAALTDYMRFLMGHRQLRIDDTVHLPSGVQVRLRGSMTELGHEVIGIVGTVTTSPELLADGSHVRRSGKSALSKDPGSGPESEWVGASPGWRAAASTITEALQLQRPVLVLGEPGSGRFTLLSDAYGRLHTNPRVLALDAIEMNAAPQSAAEMLTEYLSTPVLLVVRDLDRLTAAAGRVLAEAIRQHLGASLALTATATQSRASADQPLLALFEASATVPSLRYRAVDLPHLARAILAELCPHGRVTLSEEVLRVFGRHRWPGNIQELRDVIAAAVSSRPVGTIGVDDLPAYCQSTPRSALREVDKVERDAIVAALREARGNRKAAAAALGLARSTLYRKIRQYGVTD